MSNGHLLGRLVGHFNTDALGDPASEILPFHTCRTPTDARAILREQVESAVAAILTLVEDVDAFDVIELMRMREFSISMDPRDASNNGASLPVEIIAAVLLARRSRKPHPSPREHTRPHVVIERLHEICSRLGRIASYRQLAEGRLSEEPLARLASEYQGAVLNIRNLQYNHIRDKHDRTLLGAPVAAELMHRHLGYSYSDVVEVRTALSKISADRMTLLRDETGHILSDHQHLDPKDIPREVMDQFMAGMTPFLFLPADRSVISPADVAKASSLSVAAARNVLTSFSQEFDDSLSPGDRVFDLLMGNNSFLVRPLMSDGDDSFALTSNDIGLDVLRRIFERSLPTNSADVRRYDQKVRQPVSEELASEYLSLILGAPAFRSGYHYLAPKKGVPAVELGPTSTAVRALADEVEGDALFVIDDVAIVVEVKGKSIADQARRGDVRRLKTDLKATLGDGARQATRVRELIEENGGIWETGTDWLDLSHIREVRSVVVVLDDIGPLGTNLADLQNGGLLPRDRPPLVISLHDLAVIAKIGERPSEFLLYVRRRTDSAVTSYYRALDELDLYMLFLSAELYVEEDPDEIKLAHPASPPVTKSDRRRRERSAVGTMVSDVSAELTMWMNRDSTPYVQLPVKPSMQASRETLEFVDRLAVAGGPGWLRCGADLLALSGDAQRRVFSAVKACVRSARGDGRYHTGMTAYSSLWGFPIMCFAAHPKSVPVAEARRELRLYTEAKQYQLQADRAYGWVFDDRGSLEEVFYINEVAKSDAGLDQLVADMRLQPVGRSARPVPPSANRATKRLAKGKRR